MSQAELSICAEKKETKEGDPLAGLTIIMVGMGANGTTSKQPIRFEQTLTAKLTNFNTGATTPGQWTWKQW